MLQKILKTVSVATILSASSFANAGVITLDFEGVGNTASINDFYNGGTDSQGNSGFDYGVGFGSDALACVDSDVGGSCGFANEPTNDTVMFFLSGSSVLNYGEGFDTGFSFYYSSSAIVSIDVYSGLGLTGDKLGSIDLAANWKDNGCSGDPTGAFCNWDIGSLNFAGTAMSIDFGGAANNVGFDNITFGSTDAGTGVPEPSTFAFFALALFGLVSRKVQKK